LAKPLFTETDQKYEETDQFESFGKKRKRIKNMRKRTKNWGKPINKLRFLKFLKKAETDQKKSGNGSKI